MEKRTFRFSQTSTDYYFESGFSQLRKITDHRNTVLVTDENIYSLHKKKFHGWNAIVIPPGEYNKVQPTADDIIAELLNMNADRSTTIVGVGGGVVTDLTGYVASIYMRGTRFGFVPSSLLAMVDASIGGKNGVDVGVYKNLVGVIRQPSFIIHDLSFLDTLPPAEWENGFAEIIKHACIRDAPMMKQLERSGPVYFRKNKKALGALVKRNALLKTKMVQHDEFELGDRKLLNFGHTLGHALENRYALSHGQAISIGMAAAARISREVTGYAEEERVRTVLQQFGLPTTLDFDRKKVVEVLAKDKKREKKMMNFILLESTGKAIVKPIPLARLEKMIGKI